MEKSTLLESTLSLLNSSKESKASISRNAKVSRRWLFKLQGGDSKAPDLHTVERLYNYLMSHSKADS